MAAKKSSSKKPAAKTIMQKIGETASHLKDEIVSGKDHLVEVANDAVESIKGSIHNITHKKKSVKAKAKKSIKKAVKKASVKKTAPVKKIKKAATKK